MLCMHARLFRRKDQLPLRSLRIKKNLHIKLRYGTQFVHRATGPVERGVKSLKNLLRTNLVDNCNLNEALYRSIMVKRTTVHSKINETTFERHYCRKPRTGLTNFSNLPTD